MSITKKTVRAVAIVSLMLGSFFVHAQDADCRYQITSEWNDGYTGTITIANTSSETINGWSVNWQYDVNRIANLWNAQVSGENPYNANALSWNSVIQPGAQVAFGFQVRKNGGIAEQPYVYGGPCADAPTMSSSSSSFSSSYSTSSAQLCSAECIVNGSWEYTCSTSCTSNCVSYTQCDSYASASSTSSATSSSSSSIAHTSSSAGNSSDSSLGSGCGYTGVECTVNGSWEFICANNCTTHGGYSCVQWSQCDQANQSSSSESSVNSSASSLSSASNSSDASACSASNKCDWFGTLYPLCEDTNSGWGWENGHSWISTAACGGPACTLADPSQCGNGTVIVTTNSCSTSSGSISSVSSVSSAASSNSSGANVAALKNLVDFPIGVAVSAGGEANSILRNGGDAERALVERQFSQLTPGNIMKMSYLHPAENTYTFAQADALIDYAADHDIAVHAHTLVWHSDYQVPEWMKNFSGDYGVLLQTHVQTIAAHFAGRVASWDVVNEAFADDGDESAVNGYRNSLWYQKLGADFIEQAFIAARAADSSADLYYNDYNLSGGQQKFTYVLAMVDDFIERGIPIDGVGFQMHINIEWPSATQIKAAFQAVVDRGLKVKISELDIPVNTYGNPNAYATFTAEAAARQKAKYREVVAAYLAVVPPAQRGGITVWGLRDGESWLLDLYDRPDWPLLFTDELQTKPAFDGFVEGLAGE